MSRRNPATLGEWGHSGKRVIASESYWRQPVKWNRAAAVAGERHRVFCASLADVFEDRIELFAPRVRLYQLICDTPNLDWLLLTKRPENREQMWPIYRRISNDIPENVWMGVSIEDATTARRRIPPLLGLPAAVKFLSIEPLLAADCLAPGINWSPGIDWVIVGGEFGRKARPCNLAWIRTIVAQCRDAGVPVFVKQLGKHTAKMLGLKDRKGGNPAEWPEDLRVREFPIPKERSSAI